MAEINIPKIMQVLIELLEDQEEVEIKYSIERKKENADKPA